MRILSLFASEGTRHLHDVLSSCGYHVETCTSWVEATTRIQAAGFDMVLLDGTAREFQLAEMCVTLRRLDRQQGVLVLAQASSSAERALVLDAGADDYLSQPYELPEAVARVRALARRTHGRARVGAVRLIAREHAASIRGEKVEMTPREYALLSYLLDHLDQTVTRSELLAEVWGNQSASASNVIAVHVARLREKLGPLGTRIRCVRGVGYRLSVTASSP